MAKRWYELSTDVCILISKIELVDDENRTRYAKLLLNELKNAGYVEHLEVINNMNKYSMKRWYDKNKDTFVAFEYLKDAKENIQNIVVKKVLEYMNKETSL